MPRRKRKYYYIYKTTCKVNGKFYVGMHCTDNLEDGYIGSGKRLRYSIGKHGADAHIREIIEFLPDRASLKKREAEIITEHFIGNDLCMNLKVGGEGGWEYLNDGSDEHRERCSAAGKKGNLKRRNLFNTDETYRMKLIEIFRTATIKRGLEGKNENFLKSEKNWNGKKHSEETKKKMRDAKVGQGKGKLNSQFGTCWINDGNLVQKVKKKLLENFLSNGWKKGRKIL